MPALATTFTLDQVSDVVTPSTQGSANTTFFGWELFDDPGSGNPINDTTPDLGTTSAGVAFATTNGENHRSGSGNVYVGTTGNSLYEQITVATDGTVGSGYTTIIAQFVTAFGDFPGPITLSQINGITPTVVRGINAAGEGQVWAKWEIPSNAASYTFTITGPAGVTAYSIDRLVVDTYWNASAYQPDVAQATVAQSFTMKEGTTVVDPTGRGNANTTYFGWDLFTDTADVTSPIDDSTPDIGTTSAGVRFRTTNAEDHLSSSKNYYSGSLTMAEEVTVATSGTVGSGYTTIIAQGVTAFGGFGGPISFSAIEGVTPTVVQTTNAAGKGQVWAKWKIPGNAASYTFTMSAPTGGAISLDKFIIDTFWSSTSYQPDEMRAERSFVMDQLSTIVEPGLRGTANTTYFGWDLFTDTSDVTSPIDDSTPDIGTTSAGVRFRTTNSEDHLSSSKNYYSGSLTMAEEVTVATSGTVGSGYTTIIAQGVTAFGGFGGPISFSAIEGVTPTVVQTINLAGKGQVWAQWKIPGNAASYTFTMSAPTGGAISLDKFIVDTFWSSSSYQGDVMRATATPAALIISQVPKEVTPTSRGSAKTTWFGWEAFNNVNNRSMGVSVINDSTPDIGHTTTAGANFQTTNSQGHVLSSGNLYFLSGTLAEQITVPTNGTVGSGYTTIILQFVSATGSPVGGEGGFAGAITLDIDGTAPTLHVEGANSNGAGQLWAKWELPGNQASYTINVAGPANQAHFSFDRVVVDTLWSPNGYLADSMAAAAPAILTASPLPVGGVGMAYSVQLSGEEGNAPYSYSLSTGSLPGGLSLSSSGLIDGSPTTAGASSFTVLITDANGLTGTKAFDLTITTTPQITTDSLLPLAVAGVAYTQTFAATGGTTPYTWSVSAGTLPTGLSLSSSTGELSGTPTSAGESNFTLEVEDANGFTTTKAFSVTLFDLTITTAALPGAVEKREYVLNLAGSGGTQPYAWSISAGTLPAWLTLNATTGELRGTPVAGTAGTSTFTVQLTDDDAFAITKEFSLTVTASYQTPVMNAVVLGATTIGAPFTSTVSASNYPDSFLISGLPKGLVFNAKTGLISGKPSVTGVFNVQVAAKNKGGTSATVTAPLVVKALPSTLVGSFTGLVARDTINANLGSKLSLTTAANGSFTAKITTGTTLKSATGFLAATAPQVSITVDGKLLSLTLANNTLTGTYGSAAVSGYRQIWNAALNPCEDLAGYYSIALELASSGDVGQAHIPQGYGFATFTLSNAGTFTLAGKTADGQAISSPGFLGPHGELCVYASQYVNKGSLCGVPVLTADAGGLFVDNTAAGTLSWFKQATTAPARTYLATFGPLDLNAYGKYLAPKATGSVVLGLPDIGSADLDFSEADLSLAAQNPDISFTYSSSNVVTVPTSATKTSLTINKASGAISGKFTLTETTPPLVRKDIAFSGQTVRFATGEVKAIGYFLLPQIPTGLQTAKTSPFLSGAVAIED